MFTRLPFATSQIMRVWQTRLSRMGVHSGFNKPVTPLAVSALCYDLRQMRRRLNMKRVEEALDIVVRAARLGEYDSNVIGMAAEVIAEVEFGMTKSPRGSRDVDGTWFIDGRQYTVQVKGWSEARVKRYKQFTYFRLKEQYLPDVLLCILVYCTKPCYEILYNGSPRAIGYVEKNGRERVIRFADMKSPEEVVAVLRRLGVKESTARQPRPKVSQVESGSRKMCSICGVSFPIEEFHYGNRVTNSYCKKCCKAHGEAYARGGRPATQIFRDAMRKKWKS